MLRADCINWRLVVNLSFLLLLLLRARGDWLARASDHALHARAARKHLTLGVASFVGFLAVQSGIGIAYASHEHDVSLVWGGLVVVTALANVIGKKSTRLRFTGYTR